MTNPNALYEDMERLNTLFEELCWGHDDELIFTHENGRVVIYNKSQEQNKAAIDRAKAAKAARADAKAAVEAKKKEREDISAEIAASREEKIDQREADKKKNDSKRMAKERIQSKRREAAQQAMKES